MYSLGCLICLHPPTNACTQIDYVIVHVVHLVGRSPQRHKAPSVRIGNMHVNPWLSWTAHLIWRHHRHGGHTLLTVLACLSRLSGTLSVQFRLCNISYINVSNWRTSHKPGCPTTKVSGRRCVCAETLVHQPDAAKTACPSARLQLL